MHWQRRRHGDIEKGICVIDSWDDFKRELKMQLSPKKAKSSAHKELKKLRYDELTRNMCASSWP